MSSTGVVAGQATVEGESSFNVPYPPGLSVDEAVGADGPLASVLKAGLENIDQGQTVTFKKYVRLVNPFDGTVFWIRANLVNESALVNGSPFNAYTPNQAEAVLGAPDDFDAPGSLHFTTVNTQNPDESFSINRVVFTSEVRVNDLNDISPDVLYIADHAEFRYAFSTRTSFYKQADLYHYEGDAVYPVVENLIIDNPAEIATSLQLVSNSLPIWLKLAKIMPMYPSYLAPDNVRPPYATVHIGPEDTTSLQSLPYIDQTLTHWQLAKDVVKITMYGLTNGAVMDFYDYVLRESLRLGTFGLMNSPIVREEKRGQVELSVLAMKKSMVFEISYYQTDARNSAYQLIREAIPTFIVAD